VSFSPATVLLTFVACLIVAAGFWSWLVAATKAALTWSWLPHSPATHIESALQAAGLSPRLPLVAWRERRAVPWALIDLIGLVGLWLLASLAVSAIARGLGWIEPASELDDLSLQQRKVFLLANIAISLLVAGGGLTIIAVRTRATLGDLGWSWAGIAADVRLGLIGFIMLAPPTYALQGLLVWLWKPSKHPLMEMFKGTPDVGFFVLLLISAAIVAPLFEELIFRVVLQGFLEKAITFSDDLNKLFVGGRETNTGHPDVVAYSGGSAAEDITMSPAEVVAPNVDPNPYAPPATMIEDPNKRTSEIRSNTQPPLRGASWWLPIAISSAVFALLHYSHGPDWIPLLFLAAGLGYLYQRTHRLLPSLIVHAALNSLSLWGLWVQVQEGLRS
jgi:membrane protease YdiL (CAAX protease family)